MYAHSKQNADGTPAPKTEWHRLDKHLRDTAEKARQFAEPWGAGEWAHVAGLLHDLGKYSAAFQQMIGAGDPDAHVESQPGRVDHSTAGAIQAGQYLPIALAVAGHHAGLADLQNTKHRLKAKPHLLQAALTGVGNTDWLKPPSSLSQPPMLAEARPAEEQKRALELWTRFLFSALVDADFLDTECFLDKRKATTRARESSLPALLKKLDQSLQQKTEESPDTPVNRVRGEILEACRRAAPQPPGCFSLTAPTGSGKTLAGMAFALGHAVKHGLRRVIVVLPFASIIEQSAAVYRGVFGDDVVVEHHSNLDPERDNARNRLASENWDAPIIVTTTVQFFESLFANRSSACRKLHNIARSVVFLDEAQALPVGLLAPILDMLRELVHGYGVSLLISTATQPAFRQREKLPWGFADIHPIIREPNDAFAKLRRVRLHWPAELDQPTTWDRLATEILKHPCALAIVHRRQDARDLCSQLPSDTVHLSASMCAVHRLATIQRIKEMLAARQPVRVVSTQLVEAGVDIDFPVVYRALAGLDAIAQSAGRCNREGLRDGFGDCHIFVAETKPPDGVLSRALDVTRTMLESRNGALDPLSPEPFEEFFRALYFGSQLDEKGIQCLREGLCFEQVAQKFRMIEDDWRIPVVVPYGDAQKRVEDLKAAAKVVGFIPAEKLRALQPFTVSATPKEYANLERHGAVETVEETVRVVSPYFRRTADRLPLYDDRFGLVADGPLFRDPATLMV